jgi:sugar phosphate isomerase/epimerase
VKLSISNIAWDVPEDSEVAALLESHEIRAIDIAPGKYFPEPANARDSDIAAVKRWWLDRGITLIGMQALLFGTNGLNVFGPPDVQEKMIDHLSQVCRIAGSIGATKLTFGSPKNRDRSGLTDSEALEVASGFFGKLGDAAHANGVVFCLEPNPAQYGCNFMSTSAETAAFVSQLGHPSIKMQYDSGATFMNGEDSAVLLASSAHLVGHIHISEPNLRPPGDCGSDHSHVHGALESFLPHLTATIEMAATKEEPHLTSIRRAIEFVALQYQTKPGRHA